MRNCEHTSVQLERLPPRRPAPRRPGAPPPGAPAPRPPAPRRPAPRRPGAPPPGAPAPRRPAPRRPGAPPPGAPAPRPPAPRRPAPRRPGAPPPAAPAPRPPPPRRPAPRRPRRPAPRRPGAPPPASPPPPAPRPASRPIADRMAISLRLHEHHAALGSVDVMEAFHSVRRWMQLGPRTGSWAPEAYCFCASSLPAALAGPSPTQARPSAADEPGGRPHFSPGPAAADALGSGPTLIEGGGAGCPISFHWGLTPGLQTQSLQGPGAGQGGGGQLGPLRPFLCERKGTHTQSCAWRHVAALTARGRHSPGVQTAERTDEPGVSKRGYLSLKNSTLSPMSVEKESVQSLPGSPPAPDASARSSSVHEPMLVRVPVRVPMHEIPLCA
ncbi:hypothetical protein ABFV05_016173 [Capra hircus]